MTTTPGEDPNDRPEGGEAGEERASGPEAVQPKATPLTQQIGRIVVVVLLVLFGVFAVANSQPVDFSWVFGASQVSTTGSGETSGGVPLIVLLVVSFVTGAVVGALLHWQTARARRLRKAERDQD
ncbi:MAG: LapA family protein [Nitriliruptoraceae bacterium]